MSNVNSELLMYDWLILDRGSAQVLSAKELVGINEAAQQILIIVMMMMIVPK